MKPTSNGVFQGDSPLNFALPLVIVQICLVVALTRGLAYLLRQPRVIAEVIMRSDSTRSISFRSQTVEVMRAHSRCNLFTVGRMPEGQLDAALNRRSECPELGPIGNLLISSGAASVVVVQQYRSKLTGDSLTSLKEEDMATDGESESQ